MMRPGLSACVFLLLLLFGGRAASAQEPPSRLRLPLTAAAIAAGADWASTYYALKHYHVREVNPLIRRWDDSPAKMVAIGAAIDAGAFLAWNHTMGQKHPRVAAAGLWAMTALRTYLVVHNMRNTRRAARR